MILNEYLYFEAFVVVDPGMTNLERGQLLSEEAYLDAMEQYGDEFDARMGAEAIRELLRQINLEAEIKTLREELPTTTFRNKNQETYKTT